MNVTKTRPTAWLKSTLEQTFSSLEVRNFRLFAIGQGISLCGTWAQTVAIAWLVLTLTGSGTQLGLVVAVQFLPILLLGIWGGIIADSFNKRRILFFTQSLAAVLALLLGLLTITHVINLWSLYALAAATGFVQVVDVPARQAFVIEMVGSDRVKNAVTLNAILVSIGRIIGPTLAGVLISTMGIGPCFIVNALSFIAVVVALSFMRKTELLPAPQATLQKKGQIRAGLRYAMQVKEIRTILLMMFIVGTLAFEFPVVLPLLARNTFHGGARTYSALTAVMSLGALAGGLYTAGKQKATLKTITWVTFYFGISIIILALMPNLISVFAVLLAVGLFSILFIAMTNASLQLTSSPEMRGRVMALLGISFLGTTPIGGPIIGYVSSHYNPRVGLMAGGIATVLAAGVGAAALKSISRQQTVNETAS